MVVLRSLVEVDGWGSMVGRVVHGEGVAGPSGDPGGIDDGPSVTRNFFMGGGPVVSDWLVSVSEIQMGDDGLVMAVTVLTSVLMGTESSSVSLSSMSKGITTIGRGTGKDGWVASEMGEY